MDESTLIKSGEVCIQEKRLLKSSWVKRFCLLHKKTGDSHAYMEIYDDQEAFKQHKKKNKKCDRRIELQHVRSIKSSSENTAKGMEHHIEIRLKFTQKHNLMFSKESDFNDWFAKLNSSVDIAERGSGENSASYSGDVVDFDSDDDDDDDEVITLNQMYASTDQAQRFEVEVETSDLAKLCGIEGKMILLVGTNDLAFEDPKTKRIKYSFQLAWMRRFGKYKAQSFNFEVGRKCPNGEGSVNCITPSAKMIHKIVTKKSSSRSKLVIPHAHTEEATSGKEIKPSGSASSMEEKQAEPPPPIKDRQPSNISQPIIPNSLVRKHPGKTKTPNLIPIVRQTEEDESFKKPQNPPQPARRGSKNKLRHSGKDSPIDENVPSFEGNGHARATSYKVAVNSGDFTKELEQKLHVGNDELPKYDQEKGHEQSKKDSVKTKEDKKREKEERKEREKREKEEKKEKEKREKELEKERRLREKEEKKSGKKDKHRDSSKSQDNHYRPKERIYDEPEISPPSPTTDDDPNSIYDEATSPVQRKAPAVYAQSAKKSVHLSTAEDLYDEAVSANPGMKKAPEKVEYAEPYSKKGGVPVTQEPAMYADVKTVEKDAWKKLGRKEEEEFFEEDYSNIKSAREIVKKQTPPPVPAKNYGDENEDESENMYNTVDLKKPRSASKSKPENLYGMASAKEVGTIPTDLVLVPEADYPSDSGESLPDEEATYDDPQYDGYEASSDIKKKSVKKTKVVEAYEEAVVPVAPPTPKKQTQSKKAMPQELIYEEVS